MIKRFNKKGFTLVEIIVVLVILAILAAIAVPSVLGYVEEAKKEKYIAEARSIYTVIQVEETKLANEIDYTDKPSQYNNSKEYMYAKICDKGEGIVYKKTGIHLLSIQEAGNGELSIFWKSEDGKTIWAMIFKNKEIKIEKVYNHSL